MNQDQRDQAEDSSLIGILLGRKPTGVPANERAAYYIRSYLLMRTIVGVLGILTPLVFIIGEKVFLSGKITVRGSISAYYHSPMQDIFVAALCVIAFLLITYMGGHPNTRDFWYSAIGGAFLLGVVFFPTWRGAGAPYCGDKSFPPGCSPIEQELGEGLVAHIHQVCAIGFILSLALMSFLFARYEQVVQKNPKMAWWQVGFGAAILAFGAYAFIGPTINGVAGLWIGEVGAIWSFALSWLYKGYTLGELLRKPSERLEVPAPVEPAAQGKKSPEAQPVTSIAAPHPRRSPSTS